MKFERLFLFLFLTLALPTHARPAAWYKWRSVTDSRTLCAQTSPGDAWIRIDPPYREARCEKPFLKLPTDAPIDPPRPLRQNVP